jgi:hypothetical protein
MPSRGLAGVGNGSQTASAKMSSIVDSPNQ